MEITLEIADDLLSEAKSVAARCGVTLNALVEHALRRELDSLSVPPKQDDLIEIGPHGIPRFLPV